MQNIIKEKLFLNSVVIDSKELHRNRILLIIDDKEIIEYVQNLMCLSLNDTNNADAKMSMGTLGLRLRVMGTIGKRLLTVMGTIGKRLLKVKGTMQ